MSKRIQEYEGQKIRLTFEGAKCIHSRRCVTGLPDVFQANVKGPWIKPDNAHPDELAALALACPSGAVKFERKDGGANEAAPKRNVIQLSENGPLLFRADLEINDEPVGYRVTLCRCGHSQNKPYCDGAHHQAGFKATGELSNSEKLPEPPPAGKLKIKPAANGPLLLEGPMEIVAGSGRCIARPDKTALCRCGQSKKKPYCDGSHKAAGFTAP